MHETIAHIHKNADLLRQQAEESDRIGKITDDTARVLRESGGIRLLQAKDSGGYEEDPKVFFEWVRAVAQYSPSAGWIAGVVGDPIRVAPDASDAELEAARLALEAALNGATERAYAIADGKSGSDSRG